MNPKLSVEIGADIKGMEAALKRADQLLKQHQNNYKRVQSAIGENTQKTLQLEKSLSQLNDEFKRGAVSQSHYSKESDRLSAELRQVNNETNDWQKELKRLDTEMDRAAASTANYVQSANRTQAATGRATGAVNQLGNATRANAVPAMMSFSQVVQDAPYGIQGVANNITQLTAQMGYLSKGAGGAMGALKLMASSLMGPAGILLGVSLVTTALVTYGDKLFDTKTETEKLKEETEKAREELDNFIASLNNLDKVKISATVEAKQEEAELKALNKQLQNTALEEEDRKAAFDRLKSAYPTLLKNLDFEKAKLEGVGDAYAEIKKRIDQKATSANAADQEAKNLETITKLLEKEKGLKKDLADAEDVLTAKTAQYNKVKEVGVKEATALAEAAEGRAKTAVATIEKELRNIQGQRISLELENIELAGQVTLTAEGTVDTSKVKADKTDPIPVRASLELDTSGLEMSGDVSGMVKWKAMLEERLELLKKLQSQFPVFSAQYRKYGEEIESVENRLSDQLGASAMKATEGLAKSQGEAMARRNEIAKALNQEYLADQLMMAQALSQAFGTMANSLVDSLTAGELTFASFAKTIMSTMSKMVIQLAQQALMEKLISKGQLGTDMAVSQGNAAVAATSLAASMGPAGFFALPGLLASMSGLVGGFFGGLQAFANGGIVGGNSTYGDKLLVRANSGELILNRDQQKNLYRQLQSPRVAVADSNAIDVRVHGRLSGRDVLISGERTRESNGRAS